MNSTVSLYYVGDKFGEVFEKDNIIFIDKNKIFHLLKQAVLSPGLK